MEHVSENASLVLSVMEPDDIALECELANLIGMSFFHLLEPSTPEERGGGGVRTCSSDTTVDPSLASDWPIERYIPCTWITMNWMRMKRKPS
jgi:hypothetical protein